MFQFAVLDAVAGIDIQSDEHPEYQPDPCVGRQETHHAQAGQDAQNRNQRHKRSLEGTGSVRHGLTDYQDGCTYQGEGKQGTDAGHFSCYLRRDESSQQAYQYHEQEIAMYRGTETFVDA